MKTVKTPKLLQHQNSHNFCNQTNPSEITGGHFLRLPQILNIFGVSRTTWYKWISEDKAPKPIKLGPQISAWRSESIRNLIDDFNNQ